MAVVDVIYDDDNLTIFGPPDQIELSVDIGSQGNSGTVQVGTVSTVAPGTPAIPSRFLTRNRLIAALSNATLVVEAAFRSGSLRTARDAAELMRPVMAIRGPITSPVSEGCHRLIGERAAEIVTSVADAVEFLAPM